MLERKSEGVKPFSYEVTKIESLSGSSQNGTSLSDALNNSIPAAKLLENVEKSYDKGVKLLDASEDLTYKTKRALPNVQWQSKSPCTLRPKRMGQPFLMQRYIIYLFSIRWIKKKFRTGCCDSPVRANVQITIRNLILLQR